MDTTLLTILIGLLGLILGTFLSPYLNRRLNTKYNKIELFFNKKLTYFEEIAITIENNIKLYHNSINQINKKANKNMVKKLFKKVRVERKKFLIKASPIYFSGSVIPNKIRNFTQIENGIFHGFEDLVKSKKKSDFLISDMKIRLENLKMAGSEIINEARRELIK